MGKEINTISQVMENPAHPFVAIVGGAKVSDKLNFVHALVKKCDTILIGGGMAYTFLKAQGLSIGNSLYEEECIEDAKVILQEAKDRGVKLLLPVDHVCATVTSPNAEAYKVKTQQIPGTLVGLDIGPKTIKLFTQEIKNAKTIIWNGPMGVFEFNNFRTGTKKSEISVANNKSKSICG